MPRAARVHAGLCPDGHDGTGRVGRSRYQGEQDADPLNATDCNEAGPASTRFVRVAEVQAFNGNSSAQG
jgi:hypothetical protein